ncbi:MAG: hypothetical protein NVSMB52_05750 [Chloroflexota bacterium]
MGWPYIVRGINGIGAIEMKMNLLTASVLSASAIVVGAVPAFAHRHSVHHRSLSVKGTIHAIETRVMSNPDIGAVYDWKGHGTVKPLGTVAGSGKNHGVGYIAQGHATGTITVTNAKGSVTLSITYDATPGFSPPPVHGTYVITGGTGSYTGVKGSGTVARKVGTCPPQSADAPPGSCPIGTPFPVTYVLHPKTATSSHHAAGSV